MPEPQQAGQEGDEQIFALLRAKRDKLKKMPPEMQALGLGAVFDEFVKPRLRTSGLSDKDMNVARERWTKSMVGEALPLPSEFGKPPTLEAGVGEKAAAFGGAAYAKAAGIVKTLSDWDLKAAKAIGGDREARRDSFMKRLRDYAAKRESEVYGQASETSPKAAKAGAFASEIAMLSPGYEAGAALVPKAAKGASLAAKTLSRAGRGAAGFAGYEAGRTTDPSEIGKAAATGAVAGPVVDPAVEKLFGVLGRLFGSKAEKAASQAKPSATSAAAPTKFKPWVQMSQAEKDAYVKTAPAAQAKTPKISAKPSTTVASVAKPVADTKEAAQWRQRQYVKLSKAGVRPVGDIKDKVQQGMTAEQILGERGGVSTPPPSVEAKSPTLAAKVADVAIAQAEGPQAAAAIKGVTKVAEGVHGTGALGKKAVKAEAEAGVRAKAIREAAPLQEKAFEPSADEGKPGQAVPITRPGLTNVEAIDTLKGIKVEGFDVGMIHRAFEAARKSGKYPEEELRAGLEKAYQTIGQKMGIEHAETMSLEELYARLSGRIH